MTNRFTPPKRKNIFLVLEDGSAFGGFCFGAPLKTDIYGEVVFNTGMVGYPESLTDPSYRGQILALTYPLVGNYGVPNGFGGELSEHYESNTIHISGLVVSEYCSYHQHWNAEKSLSEFMKDGGITGIEGVDTRALVTRLREKGTMLGKLSATPDSANIIVPNAHPVSEVSVNEAVRYETENAKARIALVDCGCKNTIIRHLIKRNAEVIRVPWNYDATSLDVDGIVFSNGPGNPEDCIETINTARKAINIGIPTFGICLGNQILALAANARTYKLKFGHRGQNQPCLMDGTRRCFITSQNHGYAVENSTLPNGLDVWFKNLNDETNEGLRHSSKPMLSVQFHPEAMPGPVDTEFLFDEFFEIVRTRKAKE